jgi:hypothetical protein
MESVSSAGDALWRERGSTFAEWKTCHVHVLGAEVSHLAIAVLFSPDGSEPPSHSGSSPSRILRIYSRCIFHRSPWVATMRPFSFLLVLFLSSLSSALRHIKLRQSVTPPHHWINLRRAPSAHIIQLRIALPQPRFPELERHLAEISDPFHERYGEHLSKEEVEELVAPHPISVDAVHEWLVSHGIGSDARHPSPAGDWVTVYVPVAQAEKMLSTVCHGCTITASLLNRIAYACCVGIQRMEAWRGRRCPCAHN